MGQLAWPTVSPLTKCGCSGGLKAPLLPPLARILAAADVYQAMTEPRPHRSAHSPEAAASQLRSEVRAGRLDGEAAKGVLTAAGLHIRSKHCEFVAGLSQRQIDVLRLVARGKTIKQIAQTLVLSEKTIDNHIQHIYSKIGVTTRAGATLFAIEHDLVAPVE